MTEFDRDKVCPHYDGMLKNTIVEIFAHFVSPDQFLMNKYCTGVLSQPDVKQIQAVTKHQGEWYGATLLLEKLTKHRDWFRCILLVLRDDEMKRNHVAEQLITLKDNLDKSIERQEVDGPLPANPPPSHPCPRDGTPSDCVNDFDLSDEESMLQEDGVLETDAPKRQPVKNNKPSIVPETLDEYELPHDYESIDEPMDLRESAGASAPALPPPRSHLKDNKTTKNVTMGARTHGSQYDFTVEEVVSSLRHMDGWTDLSRESEIWKKLSPLRRENGHYLMWFWPKKKRPAIFVTHDRQVKSYIIHKKPDAEFGNQVAYYFIFKDQRKEPTMRALAEFHIKNGLVDKNENGERILVTLNKAVEP